MEADPLRSVSEATMPDTVTYVAWLMTYIRMCSKRRDAEAVKSGYSGAKPINHMPVFAIFADAETGEPHITQVKSTPGCSGTMPNAEEPRLAKRHTETTITTATMCSFSRLFFVEIGTVTIKLTFFFGGL